MELRHLRYFCAVADAGGFARAASVLHISQSAISEQIRNLEEELGVDLFDRREHKPRITPHGQLFLQEARRILLASASAIEMVQRAARGEVGTLTIGFFIGGTGSFFSRIIRNFRRRYPGVRVSVVEMTPTQQYKALLAGEIDIGFTRELEVAMRSQLKAEHFYSEPLMVALPKDHPLATSTVLSLEEVATERFVTTSRDTSPALFDKIIALCRQAGFSPAIAAHASVASGALTLVAAGEGIAILPQNSQVVAGAEVIYRPISNRDAFIDLVIAWDPRRKTELHESFLELTRRVRRI